MLFTLLAWIYISFLCWTWGILFLSLIKRITNVELASPHFSITCITGLSFITIVAATFSLFIPLGGWWVQILLIIPCLFHFLNKRGSLNLKALKTEWTSLQLVLKILLSSLLLLILVMSSWTIIHPDTLGYHAQTIQWIEKYRAVPGLVHLHARFGLQGFWFVDCALFGFSFTGKEGITFLNSTVLFWFFIFTVNRINFNFFKEGKKIFGCLWVIFLVITMWSYSQVRLTATSASPDFVVALFVLTIVYLLLEKNLKHLNTGDWFLIAFISLAATTIKISVAPIGLVAFVAFFLFIIIKKIKSLIFLLGATVLIFCVCFARNIITTGYAVFPSTAIDIANVDWKYSKSLTIEQKNYIEAYAKKYGLETSEEVDKVIRMSPVEWIPEWWKNKSVADKTLIILLLLSLLNLMLRIKKVIRSGFIINLTLLTLLFGIIFWFINAPDPRFGFGSILGLITVIAYLTFNEKEIVLSKNLLQVGLVIASIIVLAYTSYRFINFFDKEQLLVPMGIQKNEYKTFECDGIRFYSPDNDNNFGIIPIPSTDLDCEKFSPRGNKIEEGFRAK